MPKPWWQLGPGTLHMHHNSYILLATRFSYSGPCKIFGLVERNVGESHCRSQVLCTSHLELLGSIPPLPSQLIHNTSHEPIRSIDIGAGRLERCDKGLDLAALGLDVSEDALVLGLRVLQLCVELRLLGGERASKVCADDGIGGEEMRAVRARVLVYGGLDGGG